MCERVQKLKAHTEWLLDLFLELKENYAFLEPMLFDRDVVSTYGSGGKARVFNTIKFSFFYTCAQDLAKLTFDSDPRTPSIEKLVQAISDTSLREVFRREYSIWKLAIDPNEPPDVQEALRNLEQEKEDQRCTQFDSAYTDLVTAWDALKSSSALAAFQAIRNKLTAHSELRKVGDDYKLLDVGTLGLKWRDMNSTIQGIQHIVEKINLLIRSASFDFEGMERNLCKAKAAFWIISPANSTLNADAPNGGVPVN